MFRRWPLCIELDSRFGIVIPFDSLIKNLQLLHVFPLIELIQINKTLPSRRTDDTGRFLAKF